MNNGARAAPRPFAVAVTPDRERVLVAPSGEIDLSTVPTLRKRLDEMQAAGYSRVVLDLRDVTFLDSSGLKMILDEMDKEDIEFAVIAGPAPVQRVFEITGILERLPFVSPPE